MLKFSFFCAISSAVGGGGRSLSDSTFVEDMIAVEESWAMKRPIPLLIDEVVIDICWSKDTGAITTADDAGGGTSVSAMDKEEVLQCRERGLTKPETCNATESSRKEKASWKEVFIILVMVVDCTVIASNSSWATTEQQFNQGNTAWCISLICNSILCLRVLWPHIANINRKCGATSITHYYIC